MVTTEQRKKSRDKKRSKNRTSTARYRKEALIRATNSLLNTTVTGVEYPGGKSRESYRMLLDGGESVIATRRSNLDRARLEVRILKALNAHSAPAPRLLGTNHSRILIQEEIKGERLSLALRDADETTCHELMRATLRSLAAVHRAATTENLEAVVTALGDQDDWIQGLLERPYILGKKLGVRAPKLDTNALVRRLRIVEPQFIKWDSRPGNALVNPDGEVRWFDWEHAGKRNRMDDVAWILGDEFIPDFPDVEKELLDTLEPEFAGPMIDTDARDYLMAYGTFHMIIRLGLILKHMDGKWWDLDYCIDKDKIGVTLLCAQRLCFRGARWSSQCALTEELTPWFEKVSRHIETL